MKEFQIQEIKVKLGENKKENWKLLDDSDKDFIWLHLKAFSSGYVIIENSTPSDYLLNEAAKICLIYTKYRGLKDTKICYTPCKNLIKGENVGEVKFKSNRRVKFIKIFE